MRYEELIRQVQARGGFERPQGAELALRAGMVALAGQLVRDERRALAAVLPEPLALIARERTQSFESGRIGLYRDVAQQEGVRFAVAIEHAQVVFRVLAAALPPELVERLRKHLRGGVGELLAPEERTAPLPPRVHAASPPEDTSGSTLASGRPGSRHPIAAAHFAPAQAHSVVRSANPHADSKLSSAPGTRQGHQGDTLATGRPGSRRPLSEGKG